MNPAIEPSASFPQSPEAAADPILAWRVATELEGRDDPALKAAALADPRLQKLVADLSDWPGPALASHKSPQQAFQRLSFLADLGLRGSDPGMAPVLAAVRGSQGADGLPRLPFAISAGHGGDGASPRSWALCDAPLILRCLVLMDGSSEATRAAVAGLTGLVRDNGWPCAVGAELGSWRGPGKKSDPCPFATLAMLRLLLACGGANDAPVREAMLLGARSLLQLWEDSLTRHPYIFYMGDDFRKLKFPFVWYDILPVLDTLSQLPALHGDSRFLDMLAVLRAKPKPYLPESVYLFFKDWDFGQKKRPSGWLDFAVRRIEARVAPA